MQNIRFLQTQQRLTITKASMLCYVCPCTALLCLPLPRDGLFITETNTALAPFQKEGKHDCARHCGRLS